MIHSMFKTSLTINQIRFPHHTPTTMKMYNDDFDTYNFEMFSALSTNHESMLTGIVIYITTLSFLFFWDNLVVRWFKLKSISPYVPSVNGQLSQAEKNEKWIAPLTVDRDIPMPNAKDLYNNEQYMIGVRNGVAQYITFDYLTAYEGAQEQSKEWTEYLGQTTFIFKKNKWK